MLIADTVPNGITKDIKYCYSIHPIGWYINISKSQMNV